MTSPLDPDQVLASGGQHLSAYDDLVTQEEYQAVGEFRRKLEFIHNNKFTYLVLGDYSEIPRRRLGYVCQRLNAKPNTAAMMLIKLPHFKELDEIDLNDCDLETELQFQCVATNVSAIVMVAESRNAGSSVEIADLTPPPKPSEHRYFGKTYVAVRDFNETAAENLEEEHPFYDELVTHSGGAPTIVNDPSPYSSPQNNKFELFNRQGRYWNWSDRPSLRTVCNDIHQDVITGGV